METATMSKRQARNQLREDLRRQQYAYQAQAWAMIAAHGPLGTLSDMGCLLAEPKQGQRFAMIHGATYVFPSRCVPPVSEIRDIEQLYAKADDIARHVPDFIFALTKPGRIIGNRRVMEHGQWLRCRNLLDDDELAQLLIMERFWTEHPSAQTGIVQENGTISVLQAGGVV